MMKSTRSMIALIAGLLIVVASAVFVFVLMNGSRQETEVLISGSQVEFTGQYGITYEISEISEIKIEETIPTILRRTNGASVGDIKKGSFELEGLGKCRLFIHSPDGPYVYIRIGSSYTIINYEDDGKTEELYKNLAEAID